MREDAAHVTIPSGLLRNAATYRTYGGAGTRIGCGVSDADPAMDRTHVAYPFFALGWVLHGSMTYATEDGRRHVLRVGDVYLQLPGRVHTLRYGADRYTECWLELGGALAAFPETAGLVSHARPVLAAGMDLSLLRRFDRAREALATAAESSLPIMTAELVGFLAALVQLDRRGDHQDPYAALLDDACRLLEQGPEPRPRLERLAQRHGLSYERFRKVFTTRIGCSPQEYGLRRRLDRARALLLEGRQTVTQIAEALGYASVASFSAQFRERIGQAPGRFRDHATPPDAGTA